MKASRPTFRTAKQYIIEGTLGEVPKPTDSESYNSHRLLGERLDGMCKPWEQQAE
jgi:hypothetical protein